MHCHPTPCPLQALSNIAWALGSLRVPMDGQNAWCAAFEDATLLCMPQLESQGLSQVGCHLLVLMMLINRIINTTVAIHAQLESQGLSQVRVRAAFARHLRLQGICARKVFMTLWMARYLLNR